VNSPCLKIFCEPIYENTRIISAIAKEHGAEIWGVTKGLCGAPEIGRIFVEGGCAGLADSRLRNIKKQKEAGIRCKFLLIRIPMPQEMDELTDVSDMALISCGRSLQLLEETCRAKKKNYDVILMVEAGDLREGVMPCDLIAMKDQIKGLQRVRVAGVGANFGCFGGILPSEENISRVLMCAQTVEEIAGRPIDVVSIGGTVCVPMLFEGRLPSGVNHMRLGSAMLRGAIAWEPIERLRYDTLEFSAAWAEIARKPSKPWGVQALDAFGHTPHFEDAGCRLRGILAAGRQDVYPEGLRPSDPGIKILGASSDHLVCDIEDMLSVPDIGDQAIFQVSYAAMMTASTSEYVEKIFC